VNPSQGQIAFRPGGRSAAAFHCEMARYALGRPPGRVGCLPPRQGRKTHRALPPAGARAVPAGSCLPANAYSTISREPGYGVTDAIFLTSNHLVALSQPNRARHERHSQGRVLQDSADRQLAPIAVRSGTSLFAGIEHPQVLRLVTNMAGLAPAPREGSELTRRGARSDSPAGERGGHTCAAPAGRPGRRWGVTRLGSRPASARARRSRNSIWALVLRSSSAAHLARAS
jgi:hypothetical protein